MVIRFLNALFLFSIIILGIGSCRTDSRILELNGIEKQWLEAHPFIVFAVDNTYPPLNYINKQGNLTGLNIDLVRLIEKRLGIAIRLEGSNWDIALEKAMKHEVDGVINASALEERKSKLNFTNGFFRDPYALISHRTDLDISGFQDLNGKRIATKKNSIHQQIVTNQNPKIEIVEISTLTEGINLLLSQKVDGVFDDLAPLYYIISNSNLSNLKVAFVETNTEGSSIGVRNDDLVLLSILNKAINSISEDEKMTIQNRWLSFTPEKDYTLFYVTIFILIVLLLIIGLWSWSLKIVVKRKTFQLNEELQQRKFTEAALVKAKEEAIQSDKLKSAFLANMSHEIRTPLNSIIGFSGLLAESDLSNEERANYNKIISSSSNSLLSLIDDIIDFSKIEAGYIEINIKEVPLINVLNDLKTIYDFEISEKLDVIKSHLEFNIFINDEISNIILVTDEIRIKQIFTILINNAIKFTKSGTINVGGKLIDKNTIQLFVQDTGLGISKENQVLIFDRFMKIEDNNDNIYRGAGLGLSIAKHLVILLGGTIWVESELNKGSIFSFTIPKKVN